MATHQSAHALQAMEVVADARAARPGNTGRPPFARAPILSGCLSDGQQTRPEPKHHLLPAVTTPFVGRTQDAAAVCSLLQGNRLVVIYGLGGAGKTRLALHVATESQQQYPHGVCWIAEDALDGAADWIAAICQALDVSLAPSRPDAAQLASFLSNKRLLLVLDNLDGMIPALDLLIDLLRAAPGVRILGVARTRPDRLDVACYQLGGLALAPPAQESSDDDALRLFADAAQRSRPGFCLDDATLPAAAAICRAVDGLPMAIEMATSWLRLMSLDQVLAEALKAAEAYDGAFFGQQLTGVVEATWARLPAAERRVVHRLAVFDNGFTPQAARQIAGASLPLLASRVDQALLIRQEQDHFSLHPLIRAFARRQPAEADEAAALADAHSRFYLGLLAECRLGSASRAAADAPAIFRAERRNLHAAWRHVVAHDPHSLTCTHIDHLFWLHLLAGHTAACASLLALAIQALEQGDRRSAEGSRCLAAARARYAYLLIGANQLGEVERQLALALAAAGELGDAQARLRCRLAACHVAFARGDFPAALAAADLAWTEDACCAQGGFDSAQLQLLAANAAVELTDAAAAGRCLARFDATAGSAATLWLRGRRLAAQGYLAFLESDWYIATEALEEALHLFEHTLYDPCEAAFCHYRLSYVYFLHPDRDALQRAETAALAARRAFDALGDRANLGKTINNLGIIALDRLNFTAAIDCFRDALQIAAEAGDDDGRAIALANLADAHMRLGLWRQAGRYFQESAALGEASRPGHPFWALARLLQRLYVDGPRPGPATLEQLAEIDALAAAMPGAVVTGWIWPWIAALYREAGARAQAAETYRRLIAEHAPAGHIKRLDGEAGLAQLALEDGDLAAAGARARAIVDSLDGGRVEGLVRTEQPFRICLIVAEVLEAVGDSRAGVWRQEATRWLLATAARIKAPVARRAFLEHAPEHRALQAPDQAPAPARAEETAGALVTVREREVLALVVGGLSNQQIADRLVLSPGTVKRHLSNIYIKLNADNRVDLVNRARRLQLA